MSNNNYNHTQTSHTVHMMRHGNTAKSTRGRAHSDGDGDGDGDGMEMEMEMVHGLPFTSCTIPGQRIIGAGVFFLKFWRDNSLT